jgi:radical SAM superfamily enzyme YgiQ (UPF0313 family)
VDPDHGADVIGITGKVSQVSRMIELAREFRQRGKLVIIGGPYASLSPDDIRPHADIVVVGELEEIAPRFFLIWRPGVGTTSTMEDVLI